MEDSITVYLGLGANVGDGRRALERAVDSLRTLPGAGLEGVSRLYRTRPVGPVTQADYWNAVVALRMPDAGDAPSAALALLAELKRIEREHGRRARQRWGPRELDVDLLLFGGHKIQVKRSDAARSPESAGDGAQWLVVPHPEAEQRLFVLAPLADLAPELEPPGWGRSVAAARDRALEAEGTDAVTVVGTWDPPTNAWADTLTR
jgi:2-amino-4-hydroxy-6-hydroxymethyldihydropteridine diphosphokinase